MDILIGAVVFVLLAIMVLAIVACAIMTSTAKELTEAIKGIGFDKDANGRVRFIGPATTQFGRAPAPRKGNMPKNRDKAFIGPKNRKDWGIH